MDLESENAIQKFTKFKLIQKTKAMADEVHEINIEVSPEPSESDKFQDILYYAVSSDEKILATSSSPEGAYFKAVAQGELSPIIIRSKAVHPAAD